MGKTKPKGGKKKRRGKNINGPSTRKLDFKEDGQEYARVTKMLGDGRLEGVCSDGVVRICHIRGKMRKRVWISSGDLILVDIREYQSDKADVVHKYNTDEDRKLQAYGELTGGTVKEEENTEKNEIDFYDPIGGSQSSNSSDELDNEDDGSLESILNEL